ncbi:hypothetical protein GCM10011392_08540 [Wenxinia marina]|uniref:Enterobactin synthase component D n=1 Tax=Wenxinia marina DSM 24838 TaxID=1123501 RepID=A0A0D0QIL2_9RHOB|nr:Phosphopantetheinyl transferase component of siderophore synthetase [Wenxinia marina DSM 24838]GGL56379.1 hypothetical protein GCM10011392_08540 [Wenxinia marina]
MVAALRSLLGPGVAVAGAALSEGHAPLPEEAAAVARAIPARRAEFAAGRAAARRAMAALGVPPQAIRMGSNRAPEWPPGLTGSIAHQDGLALAAVTRAADVRGIGIDLAVASPLDPDLAPSILAAGERADGLEATAVFAAKEALYKALAPEAGEVFGFDAARVEADMAAGRFEAALARPVGPWPAGATFHGGLTVRAGFTVAAISVAR